MASAGITDTPGGVFYAFPWIPYSLEDWAEHAVELVEGTGDDTGSYVGDLDPNKNLIWAVFEGSAKPANWGERVATIDLNETGDVSDATISEIVAGIYNSLSGIQPTVRLNYDPTTMTINLFQGDDWPEGVRTIDIPITLPTAVDPEDCTVTFGAERGSARIDTLAELVEIESVVYVRLTFTRDGTQTKPEGRYLWDAEVQDSESGANITVLTGQMNLKKTYAKLPAELEPEEPEEP